MRIAALVMTVDEGADDAISEWRPVWFAFGIDLLAFLGPLGMLAAFASPAGSKLQHPAIFDKKGRKRAPAEAPPAIQTPALAALPQTPAPPKKTRQIKPAALAGDVRDFFNSRIATRAGHEIRCHEVFEAYKSWCAECGTPPISLTRFGTIMKTGLGVEYKERSKRGFYVGIAIKGTALKVVAG